MRKEYGFNARNKTHRTKTISHYENGTVSKIVKTKHIYPNGILDAAFYEKITIKCYDVNGILQSDSLKEKIGSVWGYENFRGIYKYYLENGKVKIDTICFKQNGW